MTNIIFVLLSLLVSFFVVLPILQARSARHGRDAGKGNHRATDLEERKETIYAAIKDIEFDHEMGKLSDEDFHELRQQYKQEAIALLKEMDSIEKRPGARRGKSDGHVKAAQFCWQCGSQLASSDKFCPECGQKVQ